MKGREMFSSWGLTAVVVAVVLMVGSVLVGAEQRATPAAAASPKAIVIKAAPGSPGMFKVEGTEKVAAPAPLSATVKANIIKDNSSGTSSTPAGLFVKLTPGQLEAPGKGYLFFHSPSSVFPEEVMLGKKSTLGFALECKAGRKYLVDLSLSASKPTTYHLQSWAGGQSPKYDFSLPRQAHLLFVFDAPSAGLYGFRVNVDDTCWWYWHFSSCEVTEL